jgi:hypothetical protein
MRSAAKIYRQLAPSERIENFRKNLNEECHLQPELKELVDTVDACIKPNDLKSAYALAVDLAGEIRSAHDLAEAAETLPPIVENHHLYESIIQPTNALEIMHNARWALQHDALLREDFFTSLNIERFFGLPAIISRTLKAIRTSWATSSKRIEATPAWGPHAPVCFFSAGRAVNDDKYTSASFEWRCHSPGPIMPTLEDVRQTFDELSAPDFQSGDCVNVCSRPQGQGRYAYDLVTYRFGDLSQRGRMPTAHRVYVWLGQTENVMAVKMLASECPVDAGNAERFSRCATIP